MKPTIAVALAALLAAGCGYTIAQPECGPAHPEDCLYLLQVRGAIPWCPPGSEDRRCR